MVALGAGWYLADWGTLDEGARWLKRGLALAPTHSIVSSPWITRAHGGLHRLMRSTSHEPTLNDYSSS